MILILNLVLAFLSAFAVTWLVRVYALRNNIMDIPNERSSHAVATPRGGGIAIILVFFLAAMWLVWSNLIPLDLFIALLGGGIIVAGIGYLDDLKGLSARVRVVVHLLAAVWLLYWLGGYSVFQIGSWQIVLGWIGTVIAVLGAVWLINLYNFMDGIDGLAASEGVFVCLAAGIALWLNGAYGLAELCFFLMISIAGFLIWNWSPAKIFLGDIGSGFLGYLLAALIIYTTKVNVLPIFFWLILLAVFVCDATFTLVRRVLQGKQWYKAHCEHAYQRLSRKTKSHSMVTLYVQMLNLLLLLPLAFLTLKFQDLALWVFLIVLFGLWILWFKMIRDYQ